MFIEEIKNIKSDKPELKKFGVTVGGVLAIIGALILYSNADAGYYFLAIGLLMVLAGLAAPKLLYWLHKAWMVLALVLGFVMTRFILSVLFYLIFTPMNFTARLIGKRFVDLRFNKDKNSYWNKREKTESDKTEMERQF